VEAELQPVPDHDRPEGSKVSTRSAAGAPAPDDDPSPEHHSPPKICGVGIVLQQCIVGKAQSSKSELWVTHLIPRHPAAESGRLMIRDMLCKVDGVPVKGQSLDAVCDQIRGPEGTPVQLEFRRVSLKKRGEAHEMLDGTFAVTLVRGGEPLPILQGNEGADDSSSRLAEPKIPAFDGSMPDKRKKQGSQTRRAPWHRLVSIWRRPDTDEDATSAAAKWF